MTCNTYVFIFQSAKTFTAVTEESVLLVLLLFGAHVRQDTLERFVKRNKEVSITFHNKKYKNNLACELNLTALIKIRTAFYCGNL